jgi:hypothetical protein
VAEGYVGAGISGFYRINPSWSLDYDLYGGELNLASYHSFDQILRPGSLPGELEVNETRDMIGGRLTVHAPVEGLAGRLSAFTGSETEPSGEKVRHSALALSAEYLGEALSLRAEYALLVEVPEITTNAGYVEAAWMFKSGVQVASRVEGSWSKLDGFSGSSPLLRHREAAVGVNYWFSPDLVVKASYHLVDGNRFAYRPWPDPANPPSPLPGLDQTTHLFVIGAQFSL